MMWRPRRAAPSQAGAAWDRRSDQQDLASELANLAERVAAVEQRQGELIATVHQVTRELTEAARRQRQALAALHRDLVGERKAAAAHGVFLALVPALDSLDAMRRDLGPTPSRQLRMQVDALSALLRASLQTLGYDEFHAQVGEPFAPERMEALDYGQGTSGIVLAAVRPGYISQGRVVRPVGVRIAEPTAAEAPDRGGPP
jgi:molecular chaperone GrpE (heat shock protein)